jgi:hypothetical protein
MRSTTSDSTMLAQIVGRIDTADVARQMVERFREEIAGYHRLPEPVVLGEILEVSRRNLDLFFRTVLDGYELTPADFEPFRESARNRATEGMPLEDLLHAYRLGGRLGWQYLADAALPEEQPALLTAATLVMEYIDQVSAVVAQTYMEERQHLVSEEERGLRNLLDAVAGEAPLDAPLREIAERIGFQLAATYLPFSQTAQGATARDHSRLAARLRSEGVLALTEGDRVTGVAPPGTDIPLARHPRALIARGEPTPPRELGEALEDMRLLLDLGCRLGRTGELTLDALPIELLLARSPRVADSLRRRVLGPLEDYPGKRSSDRRSPDLLQTLEVFLATGLDRRVAAERLHVHPNTLNYRLGRIEELTGLDLTAPEDLMLTALALRRAAIA